MSIKEINHTSLLQSNYNCFLLDVREGMNSLIQQIFNTYYLKPYERDAAPVTNPRHFEVLGKSIKRMTHGAMHAARVAAYVQLLHYFRSRENDTTVDKACRYVSTFSMPMKEFISYVMIAALLHDSARRDEGEDRWDKESASICFHFLHEQMHLPAPVSEIIAAMIEFKDNSDSFFSFLQSMGINQENCQALDYFRQLIHDADCLDVMRIRKTFKMKFLDITHTAISSKAILDLVLEVRQLIAYQGDQYKELTIQSSDGGSARVFSSSFAEEKKIHYEHSDDVFKTIVTDMLTYPNMKKAFESSVKL